ncbi:diacylglycerol/lipid kinase family protein [Liquorilactobacillus oeni]|uniref:DAGKc domain-containing protein n=1 Tax=Liquorilactobacillus oeni DSM 19972 TaxID=1423777 RepID=A0A0R1MC73_9LACO|nr:diacylglycerol kinase family protein [Liquorilactobacillus oeni]KRL05695.1 hypothetical protein FD46_GL000444 [Liquorilactobacillus oeni DSM 19972]
MKKLTVLFFNPRAGDGAAQKIAVEVKTRLVQRGETPYQFDSTTKAEAVKKLRETLAKKQIARIICIGGDGTLNVVATALIHARVQVPVGLIPAGTVNNFAKKWKIPLEAKKAIEVVLSGKQRLVDIGVCNETAIISSLVFGSLADISNDVKQKQKQKFGLGIYGLSAVKNLSKSRSYKALFFNDSFSLYAKVWVCLITTSNYIGGRQYLEKTYNGLHITMLNNMKISKLLNYGFFALTGNLRRSTTLTSFDIKKVIIRPEDGQTMVVRIDGDEGPMLPAKISWLHHFMKIYVK